MTGVLATAGVLLISAGILRDHAIVLLWGPGLALVVAAWWRATSPARAIEHRRRELERHRNGRRGFLL